MRRFDFVLLDADNTLFDFDLAEHLALERAMTERGLPFNEETEQIYLGHNRTLWAAFDRGEVDQPFLLVERFRRLNESLGGSSDPAQFNRDYLTYLGQCSVLYDTSLALCRDLAEAGCVLALATNGVARVQHARMEDSPLRQYVPHLFISEELQAQKPQEAFFRPILEQLGVTDPARCVMVGDNLGSDILGGLRMGLPTIWFNPKHLPGREDIVPTYIAHTHQEIKELILR